MESHQTLQALRESEERYRLLADHSTDIISKHAPDGTYVYASPACRSLLGYEPAELVGRSAYDFLHPDDVAAISMAHQGVLRDSTMVTVVYRFRRKDGAYLWFETTAKGLFNPATASPQEIVCVSRDISHRKRAEELAHKLHTELAHITRMSTMGQMASGLAHELNQPLTAISNYAQACTQQVRAAAGDDGSALLTWLERISEQAERAGQIIRRLHGFMRKSEPHRSSLDLNEVVREVVDLLEADARLHNARVHFHPQHGLPLVQADKIQVQQILVNLLGNAFEAMAQTAPGRCNVVVTIATHDQELEVAVHDQGHGLPPDQVEQVFDSFFTNKPHGMGMGLTISRSIIEHHGGRLWATPNPTGGAIFHFTLPVNIT